MIFFLHLLEMFKWILKFIYKQKKNKTKQISKSYRKGRYLFVWLEYFFFHTKSNNLNVQNNCRFSHKNHNFHIDWNEFLRGLFFFTKKRILLYLSITRSDACHMFSIRLTHMNTNITRTHTHTHTHILFKYILCAIYLPFFFIYFGQFYSMYVCFHIRFLFNAWNIVWMQSSVFKAKLFSCWLTLFSSFSINFYYYTKTKCLRKLQAQTMCMNVCLFF